MPLDHAVGNGPRRLLPPGMQVFERGWLSSNNLLCIDQDDVSLIDTGYSSHSAQTVALVSGALDGRELRQIACTHLHSDHCGGVAALQTTFPGARVLIPPGESSAVSRWDEDALSFQATGQNCPRFHFNELLRPGTVWPAGGFAWEVLAAPGHDPHSVVLFERTHGVLVSADALWEHGFGVVFPAIDGLDAFGEVRQTLQLLADLPVKVVVPGHGPVFTGFQAALGEAFERLEAFERNPLKHALHAGKVLVKFKLLEQQRIKRDQLLRWILQTAHFGAVRRHYFAKTPPEEFAASLIDGLFKAGAAASDGDDIVNAERS